MLKHDIFYTEVSPVFGPKKENVISLTVFKNNERKPMGTVDIEEVPVYQLELLPPLIKKTIRNEEILIERIRENLDTFKKGKRTLVQESDTAILGQYQRNLLNKSFKIDALLVILGKITARILSADKEEKAIKNILKSN